MFEEIFIRKQMLPDKLLDYGFAREGSLYLYEQKIMNNAFCLNISIDVNGHLETKLTDSDTNEEYILYKTDACGAYVGEIRTAIETVLEDISDKCYEVSVFKTNQANMLISYIRNHYGDDLEFLWKKFPDNAIWRRKDNKKWYAAILTVSKSKLGFDTEERVEIIDLRLRPDEMEALLSQEHYYPGWHMNKKSWYTIILDDFISDEELRHRVDMSYELAK